MEKGELNKQIGRRVRDMREFQGFTRENLCELADISVQFLAEIEAGRKSMTTHTLYKMAKSLNVTTDYLIFGETASPSGSKIMLLLEKLDEDERSLAERLLQIYVQGLSLHEKKTDRS